MLKKWLFALKEYEKLNGSPAENYGKMSEDPHLLSDKNVIPGKTATVSEKRGHNFLFLLLLHSVAYLCDVICKQGLFEYNSSI